MNDFILFLIESSAILGVLYLIYYLILRKEASFNFNRFYLLGALVVSLVLPVLRVDFFPKDPGIMDQPVSQLRDARFTYQESIESWSNQLFDQDFALGSQSTDKPTKYHVGLVIVIGIYALGLLAMIFRLLWTVSWVWRLRQTSPKETIDGVRVVKVPYQMAPFSFMNSVFIYGAVEKDEAFFQILAHEKTHISERHSLDLIIVQLLGAVFWFNPVIWWLSKSLKTTHEYIADRKMIKQGYSLVEYQAMLLRQLISNNSFGLVHNFNLSFIKKRIIMMKIQKTDSLGKIKIAAAAALTALFSLIIVQCNSKLEDQELGLTEQSLINLPVIEHTDYIFHVDESNQLSLVISDDAVKHNGKEISLGELKILNGDFDLRTFVRLEVDKDQQMKLVHDVQEILREKGLNKLAYVGVDKDGNLVNIPLMLPPAENSMSRVSVPELTPEFIAEHGIQMMSLELGKRDVEYTSLAYNWMKDPMIEKGTQVVQGIYYDETTYGGYLTSLNLLKQGFYNIYNERALEMYGKSFYEINAEMKTSTLAKEQYGKARQGYPMSIFMKKK